MCLLFIQGVLEYWHALWTHFSKNEENENFGKFKNQLFLITLLKLTKICEPVIWDHNQKCLILDTLQVMIIKSLLWQMAWIIMTIPITKKCYLDILRWFTHIFWVATRSGLVEAHIDSHNMIKWTQCSIFLLIWATFRMFL